MMVEETTANNMLAISIHSVGNQVCGLCRLNKQNFPTFGALFKVRFIQISLNYMCLLKYTLVFQNVWSFKAGLSVHFVLTIKITDPLYIQ